MTSPEPNPKVAALTGQAPAEPADAKRSGTWPLSAADLTDPEPTSITLQVPPELGDVVEDLGVVGDPAVRVGCGLEVEDEGRAEVGAERTVWMDVRGEGGGGTVADWLSWRRAALAASPTMLGPSLGVGERDELAEAQDAHDRLNGRVALAPVLPVYTAWLTIARGGPDEEAPDVLYQATVTGPAEFVERAVASTADAFRDHAER